MTEERNLANELDDLRSQIRTRDATERRSYFEELDRRLGPRMSLDGPPSSPVVGAGPFEPTLVIANDAITIDNLGSGLYAAPTAIGTANAAGSDKHLNHADHVHSHAAIASNASTIDHTGTLSANARLAVAKNSGATVGTRRRLNLVEGLGITLTITDDAGNEEVDATVAWAGLTVRKNTGANVGTRPRVNLIEGTNVTLTVVDDGTDGEIDVTIAATGGSSGTPATTVEDETTFGISPAVGTDTEYARQDHTHGSPADPVPAHEAAGDPHPGYTTAAELAAYAQPLDAELTALAGLTSAVDKLPYFTGSGTAALTDLSAFARTLLDDAASSNMRTTLGLVIGTDVEAHDTDLTAIAGLSPTNDDIIQRKAGAWTNRTLAQLASDLALAGSYQPLDATLTALAGANWSANALPIGTGSDTLSQTSFAANTFPARASTGNLVAKAITDFGLSLVDDASASVARTTLGLVIGTDVQAFDATLAALAAANWSANSLAIGSGSDTVAQVTFAANTFPARASTGNLVAKTITDFGLSLVDDTNAAGARTTLGLVIGTDVPALSVFNAHHTRHELGGSDAIKLDDLAATDNNTDLDATTSAHGLMQKYPGGTTTFLRADGTFAAPAATATQVSLDLGSAGDYVARAKLTADTTYRLSLLVNGAGQGHLLFGPGGAGALDAGIRRSGTEEISIANGSSNDLSGGIILRGDARVETSGDQTLNMRVGGETQPRIALRSASAKRGLHLGAGGSTATDVNLYRSAADVLATDDKFLVVNAGGIQVTDGTTTSPVLDARTSGAANPRFQIQQSGAHSWGAGAGSAVDITLSRTAARTLTLEAASGGSGGLDVIIAGDTGPRVSLLNGSDTGIWFGGGSGAVDSGLYRGGAGSLTTNDALTVVGPLETDNKLLVVSALGIQVTDSTTSSPVLDARTSGAANPRFRIAQNGAMTWGAGGASAPDMNVLRGGAGFLVVSSNGTANNARISAIAESGQRALFTAGISGETQQRAALYGDATLAGIEFGDGTNPRDTNLYRAGASVLATDDTLRIIGSGGIGWEVRTTGDSTPRLEALHGGDLRWSAGSGSRDIRIYRNSAKHLLIDDSAGGDLTQISIQTGILALSSGANLFFAADTRLYRAAANMLGTDDGIALNSAISPTALAANTDNYNPTNVHDVFNWRFSAATSSRNLTGVNAGVAGETHILWNVGTQNIVLVHNATSTAANQFLCPGSANLTLTPNSCALVWYDSTSSRWRVMGGVS